MEEDTGSERPGRRGGQELQTGLESGRGHFVLTGPKRGIPGHTSKMWPVR